MAAANESQGLKIAVAAFVSLTVVLAVISYFLYSAYDKAEARRAAAVDKENQARKVQGELQNQRDELRRLIGPRAEEPEAYLAEIEAEQKKVDEKIIGVAAKVEAAVNKAQVAGAQGPELQEAKDAAKRLVQEYQGEVNKNYLSALSRLADIFENMSLATTALSVSYVNTKRNLEQVNQINETALGAQSEAASKAKTDLQSEHNDHVKQRAGLLKKVDEYQTEIARLATENANLTTQINQFKEKYEKTVGQNQQQIRELRDQLQKDEAILDVPDGVVTYVDYHRYELRTNITRGMGARPQMVLSVFDRNSPGIPTEKPKGKVELSWVGNQDSIARIDKTYSPTDPIRPGDLLYSPAWSPNEPMQFALIGKIDLNRDGKDDRDDLKRMIAAAGGIVTYDLPPPEAGREKGKLTGREAFYVIDEQAPLVSSGNTTVKEASEEYKEFLAKKTEAVREARFNGVKPLRKERLLTYLGYDFSAPVRSGAEGMDSSSLKLLIRARPGAQAKPATAPPVAEENTAPEEEK
jgi:archaellum component FlaC